MTSIYIVRGPCLYKVLPLRCRLDNNVFILTQLLYLEKSLVFLIASLQFMLVLYIGLDALLLTYYTWLRATIYSKS